MINLECMPHRGLSEEEALKLKNEFGENSLPSRESISWLSILLSQFKSPLIYILILAALISAYLKKFTDVLLIFSVVIVNALMGFYQEFHAQRTLAALRNILKPEAFVIRDGKRKKIEAKDLVPGDIVILGSGDRIPADGKLISKTSLLINEAILTGEEEAVEKNNEPNRDRLFMGTMVISGFGEMLVQKTGPLTEIGQIGKSLEEIREEKTPLQQKLEKFSQNLALLIAFLALGIFILGVSTQNQNPWEMLRLAVVLAVAAIPEGLPIAATVVMILGTRRVLKKQGLVKKLLSIETLGSTSVICTDKTGTLTEGIMKVVKNDFINPEMALKTLILTNEQRTNLEIALWDFVKKEGWDPQKFFDENERLYQEPFDSEKKYNLSVNKIEEKNLAFLLGAPEIILNFCRLREEEKNAWQLKFERLADEGLRILGMAFKEGGSLEELKEKSGFTWLGVVGIEDPLRPGVKEVMANAQQAGIKIKLITGDYLKTAQKVAYQLGLPAQPENILEGQELELINEEELKKKIENIFVFARVSPHQKLKIVKALQENGEIVAMTGDGVNDAPALKKADIGVAVGSASEVAKETADLVLLDNNFKTIVTAIEEGRLVFANLKKVIGYVLSNSFAEMFLILGAMILGIPAPLTVVQILWIHLICDGPPDILLSFEPKEKFLMAQNPKKISREELLGNSMKFLILTISLVAGLLALGLFWFFLKSTADVTLSQTFAFATLASVDLIYIFAFKNFREPIFKNSTFLENKVLFWGVGYGFLLLLAAVYVPPLNRLLGTTPLGFSHWLIVLTAGVVTTAIVETVKYVKISR